MGNSTIYFEGFQTLSDQKWFSHLWYHPVIFAIRRMFIFVGINETSFETLEDTPDYVQQAFPYFFLFIFIEAAILAYNGKPVPRLNDSLSSLSAGLFSGLPTLMFRSIELATYI